MPKAVSPPPKQPARRAGLLRQSLKAPARIKRRFGDLIRQLDALSHQLDRDRGAMREIVDDIQRLGAESAAMGQAQDALRQIVDDIQRLAAERAAVGKQAARGPVTVGGAVLLALGDLNPPDPTDLSVSVILPTWQRASVLGEAIQSVISQTHQAWELWVIDDGSDDDTETVVKPYLTDARVRYHRTLHAGAAAARNRGLDLATGEVIAFLDSDNTWRRTHLARLVHALETAPQAVWAMSGQVLVDGTTGELTPRMDNRSGETLIESNFVDLNVIAVRRTALNAVGGFDESLTRLIDWELVLRLAKVGAPARTDAATTVYRVDRPDRITSREPYNVQAHAIRARHRGFPADGLKVLLAEWHYPQVTETYIAALVQGLTALGADVHVWSQDEVAVPYPSSVPVLRGELADAIANVRPDVIVTHWINKAEEFRSITKAAGVPHIVRVHGFEFVPETITRLLEDDGVMVHTFPHLVAPEWAGHSRLSTTPTLFDDDRYRPRSHKDSRLVVRTAAGLLTKDLDTFLMAATAAPDHRFVLVVAHAFMVEERTEMVIDRARELGSRCEIVVDLQHDEVAELVGKAGIYMHTHGTDHPVSMPVSIAEAMATGCWVLGRDLPGMSAYIEPAGSLYTGDTIEDRAANAADLINRSASWSPERWAATWRAASEQAFARHASRDVAAQMVSEWRKAFTQLR